VPGRKGLSWKQYIQAHLEVRATRFNLASGIPVLCPSISEKASPANTVRTLNDSQHIQPPAALFYSQSFDLFVCQTVSLPHLGWWRDGSFAHYRNSGAAGDSIQGKVASNPAGTACRGRERLSAFATLRRDKAFDDKLSCRAVVQRRRVHEIEIRRLVVADGVDLLFVLLQPSAFEMAPSVMESHRIQGALSPSSASASR
jgi:hypothetical protein